MLQLNILALGLVTQRNKGTAHPTATVIVGVTNTILLAAFLIRTRKNIRNLGKCRDQKMLSFMASHSPRWDVFEAFQDRSVVGTIGTFTTATVGDLGIANDGRVSWNAVFRVPFDRFVR